MDTIRKFHERAEMKVLLLEDVKSLGKKGDICDVKDGYGQNFLIAKKLALHATNEVIKKYQAQQKKLAAQREAELEAKRALLKKLESLTPKIKKPVGKNDLLFGAITKDDVSEALSADYKIELDKKCFEFRSPIKTLGLFDIEVKLGGGVSGTLKIEVIS